MNTEDTSVWVDLTDDSGQIRVCVDQAGVPRVELGIGTKSTFEALQFAGETHVLVNRALGEYLSKKVMHDREARVADRVNPREYFAGTASVKQRLETLYQRTLHTQERVRELRSKAQQRDPVTAGRRQSVWVEAHHGVVRVLNIDEQSFRTRSLKALEQEINDALAHTVGPSASASGPLSGTKN